MTFDDPYFAFRRKWRSLTEAQRRFLLTAYEADRKLPHSSGLDCILPLMDWRVIGSQCGMTASESDEIVRSLADLVGFLWVSDEPGHRMGVISCYSIRELVDSSWWERLLWWTSAVLDTPWRLRSRRL